MRRLKVNVLAAAIATFCVLLAGNTAIAAPQTVLVINSHPGDLIGDGEQLRLTPADGLFSISTAASGGVHVTFRQPYSPWLYWQLLMAPPSGREFIGEFEVTAGAIPSAKQPQLTVFGNWRGCDITQGRFLVLELNKDSNGNIMSFAADAEQHCDGAIPALYASIRYNSEISIEPRISIGDGFLQKGNAGRNTGKVIASLSMPSSASATAMYSTADDTAQWGVDYLTRGGVVTFKPGETAKELSIPILGNRLLRGRKSFAINLRPAGTTLGDASASITIQDPNVPMTVIALNSPAGDYVGAGHRWLVTSDDSSVSATGAENARNILLNTDGPNNWNALFSPIVNGFLIPAFYGGAERFQSSDHPGLDFDGDGRGCNSVSGWFRIGVIHQTQIFYDKLSINFAQSCETTMPALRGAIRINSILHQASVSNALISNGRAVFTVTLNPPGMRAEIVRFQTQDGSAQAGTDYTAVDRQLSFAPGETEKRVVVPLLPNAARNVTFSGRISSLATPIWIETAEATLR